jgi:hypothetical protein
MSLLQAVSPHDVVARVKAKSRALRKSHSTVAHVSIQTVTAPTTVADTSDTQPVVAVTFDEQCADGSFTATALQDSTTLSDGLSDVSTVSGSSDAVTALSIATVPEQYPQQQGQQLQSGNQLQRLRRESLRQLEKLLWFGLALLTQTKEQHQAGMFVRLSHTHTLNVHYWYMIAYSVATAHMII